jgi:REP element-mobilizing transposase RayT
MAVVTDFNYFDPTEHIDITCGDLPHWQQSGATYFITFRTQDSLPKQAVEMWRRERDDWLARRTKDFSDKPWAEKLQQLSSKDRQAFNRWFRHQLEEQLDKGHGACPLQFEEIAAVVSKSLKYFDGDRYQLGDFVVMPNHVHLLVCMSPRVKMLRQCYSWKRFMATEINRLLDHQGEFWQSESFDHLVRNLEHFQKFQKYIGQNPSKAGLAEGRYLLYQI